MNCATALTDSRPRPISTSHRRIRLRAALACGLLCCTGATAPFAAAQCAPLENGQLGPALYAANLYYGGSATINGNQALVGSNGDFFGHGGCYVYTHAGDGHWNQSGFLVASDGVYGDVFGSATALDGNRAIIGAYLRTEAARASGAAYIFDFNGSSWSQSAKLAPVDGAASDWFGLGVGVSGGTAAIGAPYADVGYSRSGAVYVYDRDPNGVWLQTTKLTISEPSGVQNYIFGWAVAIQGNTIMAGAPGYAFGGQIFIPGYVYVFTRTGSVWSQTARLAASDGYVYDTFGSALALDGTTLLVGAPLDDDACVSDPACQSGSAYVFELQGGVWTQTAKLTASDAKAGDVFGSSVSLSGNVAVIGANGVDDLGAASGAAYVFQRVGGIWTQTAKLLGTTEAAGDNFGTAVAAGAGSVICTAPQHSNTTSLEKSGTAYTFVQSNVAPAVILTQPQSRSVADGDTAVFTVTASGSTPLTYQWQRNGANLSNGGHISGATSPTLTLISASFPDAGSYRVVVQNACSSATSNDAALVVTCALPIQISKWLPTGGNAATLYGTAVAMSGTRAIVGGWGDGQNGAQAGAAWIYDLVNGVWQTTTKLLPQDGSGAAYDEFGWSVAIDGDTAVVGARYDQANFNYNAGSAFVFERIGGVWTQTAKLTAADGAALEEFGAAVSISGNVIAINSRVDSQNGEAAGSVYVFEKSGSVWSQTAKLLPADVGYHAYFGSALALSGSVIFAGSPGDSVQMTDAGAVYVFEKQGAIWQQTAKLYSPDITTFNYFGSAIAFDGTTAMIGSPYDETLGNQAGAVYVVNRIGGTWQFGGKLTAVDGAAGDWFGSALSVAGDTAVIGAEFRDQNGMNSGAAYVFQHINGLWTQAARIVGADTAAFDDFGHAVGISTAGMVIGAPDADAVAGNAGAAFLFGLPGVPPGIVSQPMPQQVSIGGTATFTVTTSGSPPTYQWRRSGVNLADGGRITGAHTAQLFISNVQASDAGSYDVVVTNDCGQVTSNVANLSLNCLGDLNGDNRVDLSDLSVVLAHYGASGATYSQGDLDQNGVIDLSDISILLSLYGGACQ